jgi:endonuclease III
LVLLQVTPHLFMRAPDAAAMAAMEVAEIQAIIQPIGLAPTKAKNLSNMSKVGLFAGCHIIWLLCALR